MKTNSSIKSSFEVINPEMAIQLLTRNHRNRPMRQWHILDLASQMEKGQWMENGESIKISKDGVLLDGQHRLAAVAKSKTEQRMLIIDGLDDEVFSTIDSSGGRSAGDVLFISGVKHAYPIASIVRMYLKMKEEYPVNGVKSAAKIRISNVDVLNGYYTMPDFFQSIFETSNMLHHKQKVLKQSEIGAYMAYLIIQKKHKQDKVEPFFMMLLDGKTDCMAIDLFRNKVIDAGLRNLKLNREFKRAILIKAWNAYITGKQVKVLSYNPNKESFPEFL